MDNPNGGMGGKTVLITGGTSGIGKATAVALAAMGANVVITGRNAERGEAAVEEIKGKSTNVEVELILADMCVQGEVRRLVETFLARHDRLDVLVNNAGVVQSKRTETPDGIETTLAVNHLAPFLLTNLLLDRLKQTAQARVITTSSDAQRWGNMDFGDLQSRHNYRGFPVYGMTKLANIMFTFELAERLRGTGVTANCLHPGSVGTNFGQNNRGPMALFFRAFKPFMRSPERGADTLVWLASSPEVEGVSGKFYFDRKEIEAKDIAYDPDVRRRLWEISEELTGLKVVA
ncbi:MAG TPA: SDR family oxidoreductase [Rubrobacter sp.]|nr:SDR family oxidoreductase [Rubrobacter sp.]